MSKGVLQSSSPVQQMMAVPGNPNWFWYVNGIRSPPALPVSPAPPTSFGSAAPSSLFPQLYFPVASGATSSSSSSSSSWQDMNSSEHPESWSQLLMGGPVGEEDHRNGNNMTHFQDQQSRNGSFAMDHIKQENSTGSYDCIYGHANDDHQQDFRLGSAASPSVWSPITHISSSAISGSTSVEINNVLEHSKKDQGRRHPPRDRAYECNSNANGGAQKKARVQPSSAQSTFKVRKEKIGDRITALHQIVSPFGKTDTASVLLEAIGYIRFLQSQIEALSLPYFVSNSGNIEHPKSEEKGMQGMDLRSRGLCLVPISCTLGVGHENNIGADHWAAANSFGGGVNFH